MMMPSITLPTGPFDWHPALIARGTYQQRLQVMRASMSAAGATHAVVHGNGLDHGALSWLTGFTPKLGPAFALVALDGAPRILFSGGPGMRPSALLLTWLEDVVAVKGLEGDIGGWLAETGGADGARLGLVEGGAMALRGWSTVQRLAGAGGAIELDVGIDSLRRTKSVAEVGLIGHAASMLDAGAAQITASIGEGQSLRMAAIAAERAARAEGAQDVRVRAGRRAWGPATSVPDDDTCAQQPVNVALAVRHAGYWAHGQWLAGAIPADVAATGAFRLASCISALRPGLDGNDLAGAAQTAGCCVAVTGIGLSLEESPVLSDKAVRLQVGDVCSLTMRLTDQPDRLAIWSVLVAIEAQGARQLWMPPGLDAGH